MTFPDWSGCVAYVVASGQSALTTVPDIPRGNCRVMTVNRSHELVPWADALYAADLGFWRHYAAARRFPGLKFSCADLIHLTCSSVIPVTIPRRSSTGLREMGMLREPVGTVGSGGNSAFQALNLTVQFGANPIYLVGFDYGGKHWHPDHPAALRNPLPYTMRQWARILDAQAGTLAAWGVQVFNLSPCSALKAYPHANRRLPDPHAAALQARSLRAGTDADRLSGVVAAD